WICRSITIALPSSRVGMPRLPGRAGCAPGTWGTPTLLPLLRLAGLLVGNGHGLLGRVAAPDQLPHIRVDRSHVLPGLERHYSSPRSMLSSSVSNPLLAALAARFFSRSFR